MSRFISPDTIIPDQYNPQALNRYAYCLNNPLKYTDPSGHEQDPISYYYYNELRGKARGFNPTEWWCVDPYFINMMGPVAGPAFWMDYLSYAGLDIIARAGQINNSKNSTPGTNASNQNSNIWIGFGQDIYDHIDKNYKTLITFLKRYTTIAVNPSFKDLNNALNNYDVVLLNLHAVTDDKLLPYRYLGLNFSDGNHRLTELNTSNIHAKTFGVVSCCNIETQADWNSLKISPNLTAYFDLSVEGPDTWAIHLRDYVKGTSRIVDVVYEEIHGEPFQSQ